MGETLTADTSGVADADGLSGATFSYQWVSNDGTSDTDIAGATDSTYTLVAADEGKTIKVRLSFTDDADNDEALTSAATAAIIGAAPVQVNSGPPSYITVWVTENTSDPNNIVTNFTVTWNDSDDCSTDYNAYLNGDYFMQLSQHHLGSAGSGSTQITQGLTGLRGVFYVKLYCGPEESGRLVSRVNISSSYSRPKPGTYSTEPPLSALGVSNGTLDPAFKSYTYDYTVPDVANDVTRITITSTPKAGYTVVFYEEAGDGVFAILVDDLYSGRDCTPSYSDRSGPLFELTDADINTAGFQVDLYDGENHVHVRVHSTNNCDLGKGYSLAITRAEGSVSVVRPNRPPVGLPHIGPSYLRGPCVGCTVEAGVSQITDRNGMDNATFGYQWLADDAEITGATGSSYTVTDAELSKTLKVRVTFTDDRGTEESVTSDATKVVTLPDNAPIGKPVILGNAEVGQTLTADVSGISDANGLTNATFSYVWVNFHGPVKDSEEYTLVGRDEGNCGCWLIVTYTDDDGYHEQVESEVIGVVAPRANNPATGAPVITGTAQVGETLTADTTGIADADGLTNVSYSYQWVANDGNSDAEITDATDSTYILVADDEGKTIKVRVSFTDDDGNGEALTSEATAAVEAAPNTPATGAPAISGTAQVGETLTADTSGIADDDGLDNVSYSFQWLADDADIAGATATTYILADADEGKAIKVRVSFTDDAGFNESLTSDATEAVSFAVQQQVANTPATGAPAITGTVQVGETLTADTSGIADTNGLENVTFTYRWLADDTAVQGATNATYTLVEDDEGQTIKVEVSFTDDAGNDETLTSTDTAAVAAPEPPAKPTGLSAVVFHDAVTLAWDNPQDDSITGYVILRRDREIHPVGTFVTITGDTGSADTTYTDDTVEPDKQYNYKIKAINEYGKVSKKSHWVRADTPAVPVPDKPTGLSTVVSYNTVTLAWDDPQDDSITGYVILRRDRAIHPVRTFVTIAGDTGSADTTYTDDTVEPEKQYNYKIKAINEHGEVSERSDWVRANTPNWATGAPTIGGNAQVGETLTAGISEIADEDGLENAVFSYQWVASNGTTDTNIAAATDSTYDLVAADAGKTIKVRVSFTDDAGNEETLTSTATNTVTYQIQQQISNSPATGAPSVTGTAQVGETLTADTSTISDDDGLTNVSYQYQWIRNDGSSDADITGATDATYTLVDDDEGNTVKVRVSFTDDAGNEETLTSTATNTVTYQIQQQISNSPATGAPSVTGTAQVGETLTADTSTISDDDGLTNVSYQYQWIRNDGSSDADITGATDATYTLVDDDEGNTVKVRVSFTDDAGNEETLTSTATNTVTYQIQQQISNSPATGAPSVTGTAQVGETLTADTSTISDDDGLTNVSYQYQWLRNNGNSDSEISGCHGLDLRPSGRRRGQHRQSPCVIHG